MDNLTQDFDDLMSPSKQFQSSTQELEITGSKAESTQTEWTFSKLQGKTDKKLPDTTYKRRLNQAKDVVMAVAYRHNLTYYELLGHLIMHESYISGRTTYYPAGEAIAEGKPLGTKNISIYKCLWLWERCEMTKRNWQNARNLLLLDKVVLKPENVLRDIRNKMCPKIDVWHPISGPNKVGVKAKLKDLMTRTIKEILLVAETEGKVSLRPGDGPLALDIAYKWGYDNGVKNFILKLFHECLF